MEPRYYSNIDNLREQLKMITENLKELECEYREYDAYEERRTPPPRIRDILKQIHKYIDEKEILSYHIQALENMPIHDANIDLIKSYIANIDKKCRIYYDEWQSKYIEYQKIQKKIQETDIELGSCIYRDEKYLQKYQEYQVLCKERNKYNNLYVKANMKLVALQDMTRFMYAQLAKLQ